MVRTVLIYLVAFVVGAIATAAPLLISAHWAHLDEVARGQETMGPGITTLLALLAAPLGGVLTLAVVIWMRRRKTAGDQPP